MAIPHVALSVDEERLLDELSLAPLDMSDPAHERAASRGIDLDGDRHDLVALRVKGLICEREEVLEATALGEAVRYRARYETAAIRLADVVALAEALEGSCARTARAFRHVAQGTMDIIQALDEIANRP